MAMAGESPDYYYSKKRGGNVCVRCDGLRQPGDWPHCSGNPQDHVPGKFGNDPFKGYVDEHILPDGRDIGPNGAGEIVQGTRIDTRSERKRLMKENGLEYKGRRYGGHVPTEF